MVEALEVTSSRYWSFLSVFTLVLVVVCIGEEAHHIKESGYK